MGVAGQVAILKEGLSVATQLTTLDVRSLAAGLLLRRLLQAASSLAHALLPSTLLHGCLMLPSFLSAQESEPVGVSVQIMVI